MLLTLVVEPLHLLMSVGDGTVYCVCEHTVANLEAATVSRGQAVGENPYDEDYTEAQ
jgi:hypothetical protein